ncbi:unnamed protein product, partial [Laminaria digitata]
AVLTSSGTFLHPPSSVHIAALASQHVIAGSQETGERQSAQEKIPGVDDDKCANQTGGATVQLDAARKQQRVETFAAGRSQSALLGGVDLAGPASTPQVSPQLASVLLPRSTPPCTGSDRAGAPPISAEVRSAETAARAISAGRRQDAGGER